MTAEATDQASSQSLVLDGTRRIIIGGFALGVLLGFGGNFVAPGNVQNVMWGVSAIGLIVASVLLVLEHALAGDRFAAAGFALLALGETRILNPSEAPGADASFAAGVSLYAPALLLIALSGWAPRWVRLLGAVAAIPFAAHGLLYLGGDEVTVADPLAAIGYTLYTLTVIGWMLTVLRSDGSAAVPTSPTKA